MRRAELTDLNHLPLPKQLVGEGKSTKQIAEVLHISVKTAEFHRGRLMKKLNVHDTANLVRYAIREGWIAL